MNKIKALTFFSILLVLSFGLGYGLNLVKRTPRMKANVYVMVESPSGSDLIFSNTLTDILEREVRNDMGFGNASVGTYTYIALGNSTIDQAETKLDTEASTTGFDRVVGSSIVAWMTGGDYGYNVTKKFTATGDIEINAVALHKSDVTDTEDAGALASLGGAQAFENNWNCTIVWVITCNFN